MQQIQMGESSSHLGFQDSVSLLIYLHHPEFDSVKTLMTNFENSIELCSWNRQHHLPKEETKTLGR